MNSTQFKLIHYKLNMDYKRTDVPIDSQTNQLITFIMNDFTVKYEEQFSSKYVVLDFTGDSYSMLAYTILKNIQACIPFNLLIYGKKRALKAFIQKKAKKERFINKRTFDKLCSLDKVITVSCYNPIYQVNDNTSVFKILNRDNYNIIEAFTPQELEMAYLFYNIPTTTDSKLDLQALANGFYEDVGEDTKFTNMIDEDYVIPITVVKLTTDNQKNNELLNSTDEDSMIFYYCELNESRYDILFGPYQFFLKNKSNIPSRLYKNINAYELVFSLIQRGAAITFIGDFTEIEKNTWLYGNPTFELTTGGE